MNAFDVLNLVESTSSTKKKIEILQNHNTDIDLAFLLKATFDYRANYYIKKLPEPNGNLEGISHMGFESILQIASSSGREAHIKQKIANWLDSCSPDQKKWFTRALLRDLRCGVNIESCVKAGFDIPVFEVQLATDAKKCKKLSNIVSQGVMVSPKLDGYRCLAIGVDGEFKLYSRNGTEFNNFPAIKESLEKSFPTQSWVFDGEIMSDSFNAMQQSAFASKRGTTVGDVVYHIFDVIPHFEWIHNAFEVEYFNRYQLLDMLFEGEGIDPKLRKVQHDMCYDLEKIKNLQHKYESEGFEGCMANPNIPYYMGRKANSLLKFKSMSTMDCEILGMLEGKGRLVGTMGCVIVAQEDGVKTCEVGSGFTDQQRADFWSNKEELVGKIMEVKYQELTPDGIMRFPVYMRFRSIDGGKI